MTPEKELMEARLSDFERRVDGRFETMAGTVEKLATSVQILCERDVRMQEREDRQRDLNVRLGNDMDQIKKQLSDILIMRAEERHLLDSVRRAYPFLVCAALVGAPIIAVVINGFVKLKI